MRDWADLTYHGKHKRVKAVRGKADRCIIYLCSTGCTTYQWACISHEHRDVMDYMPMCLVHHAEYDGKTGAGIRPEASVWLTGHEVTEATRAKISAGKRGHRHTEESKAKMSAAALGNQNARGTQSSDKAKARAAEGSRGNRNACGHIVSEEARARISAARSVPWSAARRAAFEAKKGEQRT